MSVVLATVSPALRGLAAPGDPLTLGLVVEANATSRSLTVKVGGATVLTWSGGSPTVADGYSGNVSVDDTTLTLTLTLTKTGGWAHGAAVDWVAAYGDSLTPNTWFEGSFAQVAATITLVRPADATSGVSRRPLVYVEAAFDIGAPTAVDLDLDGATAIRWGSVQTPAFEGRAGVTGSGAFGLAQPRRAYAWGARVPVAIRPVVTVSGTPYRGLAETSFVVTDRTPRGLGGPSFTLPTNPVRATVAGLLASALRPDGGSPELPVALAFYLRRSTVGSIASAAARTGPDLEPVDVPPAATLYALVEHVRPMWRALLEGARPDTREALSRAWGSRHVIEQVGALCVVLSEED